MDSKKELKADRLRLRLEVGQQLWQLRQKKKMSIEDVYILSKMPIPIIEHLEIYGLSNINISELQYLANFYGKYIKIKFVDKEDL